MTSTSPFGALETRDALSPAEIEAKAHELLDQLTLDEKIGMMDGDLPFWSGLLQMVSEGYNVRLWEAGAVPRLGIPGIRFSDGPRGIVLPGATTFPVSMARGATWDADLEERIGEAMGKELRALGGNLFGGVCINLLRHPAWGRAQETYGEDPHHLGTLGAALTRGVQRHVMACAKHYALNSMENARFTVDVQVDPRALHEVYLPHFRRTVEAGVAAIMSAYNSVNGEWCGQNRHLLHDILKEEWGFDGFVLTDFMFGMRDAKRAALAGQDLEMPFQNLFHRFLKDLVEAGEVPQERIDDAVLRLLRQQIRFGQGRDPQAYTPDVLNCMAHRQLAREAAQKSVVLLKNDGDLLPLEGVRRLAVIGSLAATPNTGDSGSSDTKPNYVVTPLEGLRAALDGHADILYDDGSDPARAAALATEADVALCVVGYTARDEGEYSSPDTMAKVGFGIFPAPGLKEAPVLQGLMQSFMTPGESSFNSGGDRSDLTLSDADEALIQAVAAANPRTVAVMMGGSAIITEAWRSQVPAILMLWYPGMEGGHALADVLLGNINPSGRLPCTFPRDAADLPFFDRDASEITYDLWHGYRKLSRDGVAAAFPFGFGLSYTRFAYANLRLQASELSPEEMLVATFEVSNTGPRAGDEVVQLYIAAPGSTVARSPRELKAFARVSLAAGETRPVRLLVPVADLAYYEPERGWMVEPLEYEVYIARHAADTQALVAHVRVV